MCFCVREPVFEFWGHSCFNANIELMYTSLWEYNTLLVFSRHIFASYYTFNYVKVGKSKINDRTRDSKRPVSLCVPLPFIFFIVPIFPISLGV